VPRPSDEEPAVDYVAVQNSAEFQSHRRKQRSFVFPMAIFFLLWYFAYVLLGAYAHDFMATPVWGHVNVGLILGLLQFVTTFGITTWYVRLANRNHDPESEHLRAELEDLEAKAHDGSRS
jgi:uncharacterized membrane protein (DUF485 family)